MAPSEVDQTETVSPHAPRRTNVACLRCRERKVRCSGTCPCVNCTRRSTECVFEQEDRKVTISERYLKELKRKAAIEDDGSNRAPKRRQSLSVNKEPGAAAHEDPSEATRKRADHSGSGDSLAASPTEESFPSMNNPLVNTPSKFITDHTGRRRFLGPSSTWAYSRHVMGMIREYLSHSNSPEVPLNVDGAALPLEFPNMRQVGNTLAMEDLPSLDYAMYLTNTVKFHVGQTYHLFDEPSFMQGLFALYNDGPSPIAPANRLWYVQYLVIMALGKALLMRGVARSTPSGSEYFMRALEFLPDANGLYQDPILSVEICCGLALYLQSVDHRNSAYVYLGLGLRIALSQGFHRDLVGQAEDTTLSRYRSVWWTLYVLDRKFSSLMGVPSSIHDSDITVQLPKPHQSVQRSTALDMHVKLSRLIAKVLNTVYGIDGKLDSTFLKNVQATLRELAGLAMELNASPELKIDSSGPISRVSATLNLCHHQCIILATRPLLMCLLRDKLEKKARGDDTAREISGPVKALLKTSHDAANKSLRILETLRNQDLLETFLPFDLDHAFSACFLLTLFSAIQPFSENIDDSYMGIAHGLLNALIDNGNAPARFRREELERLHDMLLLLSYQQSVEGESVGDSGIAVDQPKTLEEQHSLDTQEPVHAPFMGQGVSPHQMLTVASLLDYYPPVVDVNSGIIDNTWLWETEGEATEGFGGLNLLGEGTG